jgi:hypothetical protein
LHIIKNITIIALAALIKFSFASCIIYVTKPEIITAETPVITSQPAGADITFNDQYTLSVEARVSDGGKLSYQWYSNVDTSAENGTQIDGAVSDSYSPPTDEAGTFHYFVEITNNIPDNRDGGIKTASVISEVATLTVNEQVNAQIPVITSQPAGAAITINAPYELSVTARVSDGGTLSYQWYFSNASASTDEGIQVSGEVSASFNPPTDRVGTFHYFVRITNAIHDNGDGGAKTATVMSDVATLTVNEQVNAQTPVITKQPAGAAVTVNTPHELSVTARVSDGGTLSYQWYSNSSASTNGGTLVSGAASASYSPPTDRAGTFHYFTEITNTIPNNGDGGVKTMAIKSNAATLTVNEEVSNELVTKVQFTGPTATVNFNLENKNVYLVKINTSGSDVSAGNTGGVRSVSSLQENYVKQPSANDLDAGRGPRIGHPAADAFNANPPPIDKRDNKSQNAPLASSVLSKVSDTKQFWVESSFNNGNWVQRTATLVVQGAYSNIWVINNSVTNVQAKAMSDKFDIIYPAETNILGYEYGGGPGGNGGKDGDSKIQILVYNIGGNTLGYFWAKDFYDQFMLGAAGPKSNMAEIFYINSSYVSSNLDMICSTLAHEFQHMINFNEKFVKKSLNSNTWYDEMLSMMTQDVIEGLIGITPANQDHVIKSRIPLFLRHYTGSSFTNWYPDDTSGINYGKGYAFGAYLLRNYDGAALLKEILANNTTDTASITAALKTVTGNEISFEEALRRFGEAMIFSGAQKPAGLMTFDKTATSNINGFTYTAHGFDIWNMSRSQGGFGPYLSSLGAIKMDGHSITVHQSSSWKDKTGNLSITLERPANPNIEFYLMVK